jgi:uncharacterized protein YceH (UPF0502 family)
VKVLPRQPGTKEARYAHLLSGEVQAPAISADSHAALADPENGERLQRLEQQVSELQHSVAELQQELSTFRKQFES